MIAPVLLRRVIAVADTGNVTHAAARLNLTQPIVSQPIMRLEQSLDCRLLDRSQRLAQATEAGERLLGYPRRILTLAAQARQAVGQTSSGTTFWASRKTSPARP